MIVDEVIAMLDRLDDHEEPRRQHETAGHVASRLREAVQDGDDVRALRLERDAWRHVRAAIDRALVSVPDPAASVTAEDLMARLPASMQTDEQRRAAHALLPCQRAQLLELRERFQTRASPAGFLRRSLAHCARTRSGDALHEQSAAALLATLPPHRRRHEAEIAARLTPHQIAVCRALALRPSEFTTAMEHVPKCNDRSKRRKDERCNAS